MGIFDSFRKAKEAEAKASAGTNEFSNEFSNEVSNEANEAEASGSKAAALGNPELETLPKVLVRPQSDENGSLMAWEGVKKLRISHTDPEHPIHLRQIEIYGCDGKNYALKSNGGSAIQSSEMGDGQYWGPAELVIDGDRDGCVNHTAHEPDGWLEVILAKPLDVESFVIVNMEDDEWDHRMRISGALIELVDEKNRVVYSESINPSSAPYLFDQSLHCRQRWVNEDAMVFFAPLLLRFGEMPGLTKVTALNMSGEPMADAQLGHEAEGLSAFLCEQFSAQTKVPAHRFRLMLPSGHLLRLPKEGEDLGPDNLLALVPDLEKEMERNLTWHWSSKPAAGDLF